MLHTSYLNFYEKRLLPNLFFVGYRDKEPQCSVGSQCVASYYATIWTNGWSRTSRTYSEIHYLALMATACIFITAPPFIGFGLNDKLFVVYLKNFARGGESRAPFQGSRGVLNTLQGLLNHATRPA